MRLLAIETASEACSVALFATSDRAGELIAYDHRVLGRGHAEHLVPMIAALPDKGRAERIHVSIGPGSFTGVRIGIATARALGFAWGAEVRGYPTLAAVAIGAAEQGADEVTVCMNGGHGEWFVQNFAGGLPQDEVRSLTPEQARIACRHDVIAGNRASELAALLTGETCVIDLLPDARCVPQLDASLFTNDLTPVYGRAPDAKPQASAAPMEGR